MICCLLSRLSCIFLAGKIEQDFISPDELTRMREFSCSVGQLMATELLLLEVRIFILGFGLGFGLGCNDIDYCLYYIS